MSSEFRRSPRRQLADAIIVINALTDAPVGRIGNLSETGMLLMADAPLVDDALYQFRFRLGHADGAPQDYELGAHLLWMDEENAHGMIWSGFRFLAVPEAQAERLRSWIAAEGNA